MTEATRPVSDWELEQYLLEELEGERRAFVEEQLRLDSEVKERLEALKVSNTELLETFPPRVAAASIRERFEKDRKKKPRQSSGLIAALPVGAAALLAVFVVFSGDFIGNGPHSDEVFQQNGETIYTKGLQPHLTLYRKTSDANSVKLEKNQVVSEGDVLQLGYVAAGARFGVVFSVDGRGVVTLHFPREAQDSLALKTDGETLLPFSYELDDAPLFERFFLVTDKEPFDPISVMNSARKQAKDLDASRTQPLDLPEGMVQMSFLLRKNVK